MNEFIIFTHIRHAKYLLEELREIYKNFGFKGSSNIQICLNDLDVQIHVVEQIINKELANKEEKMKKPTAGKKKIEKVMHEYAEGKLHSGSKKGPEVRNPKQAIAIALNESRKSKKK